MSKKRIAYLDAIKGLALLLVIIGHIMQKFLNFSYYPRSNELIRLFYEVIYSFHMPLFMLVSGFLFYRSYCSAGSSGKVRMKLHFWNLFWVYTMFSAVEGLIKLIFSDNVISHVEVKDILLIWVNPIGGRMWFLYVIL